MPAGLPGPGGSAAEAARGGPRDVDVRERGGGGGGRRWVFVAAAQNVAQISFTVQGEWYMAHLHIAQDCAGGLISSARLQSARS
jgi:hypothetical protein